MKRNSSHTIQTEKYKLKWYTNDKIFFSAVISFHSCVRCREHGAPFSALPLPSPHALSTFHPLSLALLFKSSNSTTLLLTSPSMPSGLLLLLLLLLSPLLIPFHISGCPSSKPTFFTPRPLICHSAVHVSTAPGQS